MKTKFYFLLLAAIIIIADQTSAQTLVKNMSSANGDVYSVYKSGGSYYIGGSFSYVGLNTQYGALTKTTNDYPNMDFPQFNGQVYALIPDGNGGWYAGGYFTVVGGIAKSYLAHIKSDNSVDAAFNGNCNSAVRTILKVAGRLYIGGSFTTVNGTSRLYAAALNSTTGALISSWNPAPNSTVNSIAAAFSTDTTIWLGGNFTTINTTNLSRPYLAKVNTTNGSFITGSLSTDYIVNKVVGRGDSIFVAGDFSRLGLKTDYLSTITEGSSSSNQSMPNTNGRVSCIIADGSGGWYVGGNFTQIGGINKSYVAHVKSDKTVDANFTADCNSYVFTIVKDGTRLYLGGYFTSVNGTSRNYIAAVSSTTGAVVTGWDGNSNSYVYSLGIKDTSIIAGGYFTAMKGKNAYHLAALGKTNGNPIGGLPGYNSIVNKVAVRGDSILTGGNYTLSAYYSPYSAKMNTTSVTQDPNFPATNGLIYSVVPDGAGNYYVGGSFTIIGGVNQAYVAKLNSSFQVVTAWAPVVNNQVRSMVLSGTTLYIGGLFSTTNAVSKTYISALSTANPGNNKTFNSSVNSYVYSLVSDGTGIYAGGIFTLVNGVTTRNLLAKFDLSGNLNATWNPNAAGGGGSVEKLAISGTNILAAGSFTSISGVTRNYLAKLNNTSGASVNWASSNSYVFGLYVDGNTCYVGGYFTSLTSQTGSATLRNYLGGITISNGAINGFNPNPNSYVYTISKSGTNLYYGGQFTLVNGTDRKYVAASNTSSSALQSWNPSANYIVNTVYVDTSNSNVFLGGSFSGFQESSRTYASAIKYSTKALLGWSPVLNNVVYDITYNVNKIIIGGVFQTVNGSARNGFAAFGLTGTLLGTNLNLTKNGLSNVSVQSLFANDTTVYVGGDFDKAGSSLRNDFVEAKIATGAGTILPTNPYADNIVYAINVQGTTIAYGGDFRLSNFTGRSYVGVIKSSTGTILPWNPLPDSYVFDLAVNYNRIFIAGQFDNVNGSPHPGAASFNLSGGSLLTWNPQLSRAGNGVYADLYSINADSTNVYMGGFFDQLRGQTRNNAGAVSASTAALVSWNPGPDYIVRTMALSGTNLFIGGDFTFCKGAPRSYVAKIDSATGLVNTSWNPGSNGYIYALAGNGANIYIGGSFSQLGSVTRTSLGSVSASTGVTTGFDPVIQLNGSQGYVYSLAFDSLNSLFVGGLFTTGKGTARNNAASYTTAGALKSWNPNANGAVNALVAKSSTIFLGGAFTTLNGGTVRNHLASVDNSTGTVLSFNPDVNGNVNALSSPGNNLYVGGQFTFVKSGTTARSYLASYNTSTNVLNTWNPVSNSYIFGIASASDTVYPGGYFTTLNGVTRNRLAGIRTSAGTTLLSFNPDVNSTVQVNFIAQHMLLSGGSFSTIGGAYRRGFAVYSLPGAGTLKSVQSAASEDLISSVLPQKRMGIYPNPVSSGSVTLQLSDAVVGKFTVNITTMDGQRVYQKSYETFARNDLITISTANLKNGTYIVNVVGAQTNWSNTLIVAK